MSSWLSQTVEDFLSFSSELNNDTSLRTIIQERGGKAKFQHINQLKGIFSLLLILPSGSPETNLWAFHSHDFLQRIPGGSKRAGQEHPGRGALLHCGPQPREYPESLSRQTMKDQGAGGDCPDEEALVLGSQVGTKFQVYNSSKRWVGPCEVVVATTVQQALVGFGGGTVTIHGHWWGGAQSPYI